MKRNIATHLLLAAAVLVGLPLTASAQQSYTEDFTTSTYKDEVNTTADWNTADGELKLFDFELSLVGTYDPGDAYDIAVSGDLAVVAGYGDGIHVFDISDLSNPALLATYATPGLAWGVAMDGDHVFVADRSSGLQVIDISDPTNPAPLGTYNTPALARRVAVHGDLAFVADMHGGLVILDVSDPTSPAHLGTYVTSDDAYDVVVDGDHAFVASDGAGLEVVDTSDPTNPALEVVHATTGSARGISVSGNVTFVAAIATLEAIDITDPTTPVTLDTYVTSGNAQDVSVSGDRATVADYASGIQVFDITDPTDLSPIHGYDTSGFAEAVVVDGQHAFVADRASGLQIVKVSSTHAPILAASFDTPGYGWGIAVHGDYAFVADQNDGLQILDISDPSNPLIAGSYDPGSYTRKVKVAGDRAFVATGTQLQVLDISDPESPVFLGSYSTPANALDVDVAGDLAFVGCFSSGLLVIDIEDPSAPTLVGSYDTSGYGFGVVVAGDYAYLADSGHGLKVIDIGDPTSPSLVGSLDLYSAKRLVVEGDYCYMSDNHAGLQVIDISDPTDPLLAATYDTASLYVDDVAVAGDRCYLAAGIQGLKVIDISDPTDLFLIDTFDTQQASAVALSGHHALLVGADCQSLQIGQDVFDVQNNVGQSSDVAGSGDTIVRGQLTSTETVDVSWEVTADAGANWQTIVSDGSWSKLTNLGSDLRWRSTHTFAGINPTVSDLTLSWLNESGPITSITDVPDDQGGWVRLDFTRSGYDFAEEDSLPVTGYQIYQRVDDLLLRSQVLEVGLAPKSPQIQKLNSLLVFGPDRLRLFEDRWFIMGQDPLRSDDFPDGMWEAVGWVAATQTDDYLARVPTVTDSTAAGGIAWSAFFVTTHTTTPSIWFASEPDSGYSVDNIAPGVPSGFMVDHDYVNGPSLAWEESPEDDFQYFKVYRGLSDDFEIGPEALIHETAETSWLDTEGGTEHFYKVTALDHAGNESDPASPDEVTGVEETAPRVFALHQNSPNPFNPVTTINFDLPRAGHVRLEIFEVSGRRVATLLDESREAGRYSTTWRGQDDAGNAVSSGMYFYRLSTDGFNETRKMLLLQ